MADNSHKIIIYHNPSLRTLLVYTSYQRVALYLYWQFASTKSSSKHRLYTQEGAKPGTPQVFDGRLEVDAKDIIGLFKQHHPHRPSESQQCFCTCYGSLSLKFEVPFSVQTKLLIRTQDESFVFLLCSDRRRWR